MSSAGRPDPTKSSADKRLAAGVCTACRWQHDCTFSPRLEGRRVVECDEFAFEPSRRVVSSARRVDARKEAHRPELGLCANCAIFASCTYPKPEGYVWHCDEYL